jgi:two-component system sensor histidine kinase KdpD
MYWKTPRVSRRLTVVCNCARADDHEIFFSVSDEGPGIPEDERAKIFDMFYTAARGDRGGQGTGLGLAICQGMVGAHGGRISVADGIDGRGTCITSALALADATGDGR